MVSDGIQIADTRE